MEIRKYKNYTIKLFHNSGCWDYTITGVTIKGHPGRRGLNKTKEEALERAKKMIDNLD